MPCAPREDYDGKRIFFLTADILRTSNFVQLRGWLNVGCPAYSESQALTDTEAIELIRKAGGDAYLAHLHLTKKPKDELDRFVKRLAEEGLCGIEGYYTDYTPETETEYRGLAKKYGLKISGGTDFHGSFKPHISIGTGLGRLRIPYSVLENMKKDR